MSGSPTLAPATSLAIHAFLLAALLFLGARHPAPGDDVLKQVSPSLVFPAELLKLPPPLAVRPAIVGGGSGARMPLPDAQGQLPPSSRQPFVPPLQVQVSENPILEVPPALDLPPQAWLPVKFAQWGDPLAPVGPASNGRGKGGGIGDGEGRIPGDGRGSKAYGPGDGGAGIYGRAQSIGRGVTAPVLLKKIEPDYSEEARKAKYQGSVGLRIVVDEQGFVRHVDVSRALGLGLDEKAIEAVRQWRFRPGQRDGRAVAVWAAVEVYFRLL